MDAQVDAKRKEEKQKAESERRLAMMRKARADVEEDNKMEAQIQSRGATQKAP